MKQVSEISPTSLEEVLLIPFGKLPRAPMSKDETEMFIRLSLETNDIISKMYDKIKKKSWVLNAIERRIEVCLTVSIDKATQIFIMYLNDSNIGSCIMYLYYLQFWGKSNNISQINFDVFAMRIFPMGFPSKEDLQKIWVAQKCKSGNMIDLPEAAESIQIT